MSSSLVTLAAGGLGGVVVKAVFDSFSQRRQWRREDQHRFASIKQEVYARFPSLVSAMQDAQSRSRQARDELSAAKAAPVGDRNIDKLMELTSATVSASDAAIDALRVVIQAADTIDLIGGPGVREVVSQIGSAAYNEGDDFGPLVSAFLSATRADLRVPADSTEATAPHRLWKGAVEAVSRLLRYRQGRGAG